jgi:hypothetical protein
LSQLSLANAFSIATCIVGSPHRISDLPIVICQSNAVVDDNAQRPERARTISRPRQWSFAGSGRPRAGRTNRYIERLVRDPVKDNDYFFLFTIFFFRPVFSVGHFVFVESTYRIIIKTLRVVVDARVRVDERTCIFSVHARVCRRLLGRWKNNLLLNILFYLYIMIFHNDNSYRIREIATVSALHRIRRWHHRDNQSPHYCSLPPVRFARSLAASGDRPNGNWSLSLATLAVVTVTVFDAANRNLRGTDRYVLLFFIVCMATVVKIRADP